LYFLFPKINFSEKYRFLKNRREDKGKTAQIQRIDKIEYAEVNKYLSMLRTIYYYVRKISVLK